MEEREPPDLPEGFTWRRSRGWRVAVRAELSRALPDEDALDPVSLSAGGEERFAGRGRPRLVTLADGTRGVLRRYRHGGLLGALTGELFWGSPRPLRELAGTERARRAGVRTPEVLAAFFRRRGPMLHEGFLLTREVAGARDLVAVLRAGEEAGHLFLAVGRETRRMHDAGVWHADLHVKNVLVSMGEAILIDFDRARVRDPLPRRLRHANLIRFDRSVLKLSLTGVPVRTTDRMRLYRGYFGEGPGEAEREELEARCRRSIAWHRLTWRVRR